MGENRSSRTALKMFLRRLERILRISMLTILALAGLTYIGDYLSVRVRIARGPSPFGTVHLQPYLAVPEKGNKTEFILDDPRDQQCVHSLFPHSGAMPCWYLERQKNQRIDM